VGRANGDWPLLAHSPTAPDAKGVLHPGSTSMAVDSAGSVFVACPNGTKRNLMVFKDGAWSEFMPLWGCGTMDSASARVCYFGPTDDSKASYLGSCWAPPQAPAMAPLSLASGVLFGDVVMGGAATGGALFLKWTSNSWARVGTTPVAGSVLDLASTPAGLLLAAKAAVDTFTPAGWVSTTELQVHRFDGQTLTRLEGLDARIDFLSDATLPMADVTSPAALELAPDGNPVVAWIDSRDDTIHLSKWDSAAWRSLAAPLAATPGFFIGAVKLKLGPTGAPVVAWLETGFPTSEWAADQLSRAPVLIHTHRVGAAGWEALSPTTVTLDANGPASDLSLSLDATGGPHVAWKEADRVFVARYSR